MELLINPFGIAVPTADQAEPASAADRRRERTSGNVCHRRRDDGVTDTQCVGQSVRQRSHIRECRMGHRSTFRVRRCQLCCFAPDGERGDLATAFGRQAAPRALDGVLLRLDPEGSALAGRA